MRLRTQNVWKRDSKCLTVCTVPVIENRLADRKSRIDNERYSQSMQKIACIRHKQNSSSSRYSEFHKKTFIENDNEVTEMRWHLTQLKWKPATLHHIRLRFLYAFVEKNRNTREEEKNNGQQNRICANPLNSQFCVHSIKIVVSPTSVAYKQTKQTKKEKGKEKRSEKKEKHIRDRWLTARHCYFVIFVGLLTVGSNVTVNLTEKYSTNIFRTCKNSTHQVVR